VLRIALDTNVMAYAEGVGDARRCKSARDLVARLQGNSVVIPAQTLGELHRVLTGKAGHKATEVKSAILSWSDAFDVADSTFDALRAALDLAADHHLPIWDALILSVAAAQKCRLLLSEDFQHGFTWNGVTVVNPFLTPRPALLAAALAKSAPQTYQDVAVCYSPSRHTAGYGSLDRRRAGHSGSARHAAPAPGARADSLAYCAGQKQRQPLRAICAAACRPGRSRSTHYACYAAATGRSQTARAARGPRLCRPRA
jgi:predicted nucleic acid-binding protein